VDPSPRVQIPTLEPHDRTRHFQEIEKGLTEESVLQEARRCVSCGTCCIQACPFDAIRFQDDGGITRKCDLCHHRVEHGLYPACADNVCLAHCIHFGRAEEIEKLAAEIGEKRRGPRWDLI
jgi:Fe-S-cluster-containing dehydrogenase component